MIKQYIVVNTQMMPIEDVWKQEHITDDHIVCVLYSDHQKELAAITAELEQVKAERDRFTKWIPVADFKQEPYEGLCLVCLDNGRVIHAWHTNKQEFLYHAWSENRFDNVSYVIPLFHPQKSLAQDEK